MPQDCPPRHQRNDRRGVVPTRSGRPARGTAFRSCPVARPFTQETVIRIVRACRVIRPSHLPSQGLGAATSSAPEVAITATNEQSLHLPIFTFGVAAVLADGHAGGEPVDDSDPANRIGNAAFLGQNALLDRLSRRSQKSGLHREQKPFANLENQSYAS